MKREGEEKEPAEEKKELPVRWNVKKGDTDCQMLLMDQAR